MVDDELEMQGRVFVATFLHLDHDVPEIAIGVPRPIDDEAAAESQAMKLLGIVAMHDGRDKAHCFAQSFHVIV